ncbi:MAG: FimB/Mfa2 family fimbrial subunit, partial [Alistipes sp.]|nr:FimB/Mfa2 family fimbrial subunit [Alistipes sp.]
MKKFLLIAVAAFGMLMTACSKDEVAQPVVEESTVTFTISAPELATRALGDGTTATQLSWAVYDENDTLLFQSSEVAVMSGLKATVEIPFVNGMDYNILFWAEAPESPYSVDWANLKVGYKNQTLVSNSEKYDAFYCYFTELGEVTGPVTKTVELKRPFAQLNIITNDAAEAAQSGVVVEDVKVVVEGAYTDFDLANHKG